MTGSFEHSDFPLPSEPPLSIEYVLGESQITHEEFDGYEFDKNAAPSALAEDEEIVIGWSLELKEQEGRLAYVKNQLSKAAEVLVTETKTDGSVTPPSVQSTKLPLF